jgi:hypothetical protein
MLKRLALALLPVSLVALSSHYASVQVPSATPGAVTPDSAGVRQIRAVKISNPINIDGRLDEHAWSEAVAAADFRQQQPHEGTPASEQTEVRILLTIKIFMWEFARLLNPEGLRTYALQLAEAVTGVLEQGKFPVVLGGDCSNLIGCVLALRRLGRFGLIFIDGHADFYQPEAEPNGEVASMDLAIVSGRSPDVLTDIDRLKPLVCYEDIVLFGYRDAERQENMEARMCERRKSTLSTLSRFAGWNCDCRSPGS